MAANLTFKSDYIKMRFYILWPQIRFKRYLLLKIIIVIIIKFYLYRTFSSLFVRNNDKTTTTPVTLTSINLLRKDKHAELKKIYNDIEYRRIFFEKKITRLTNKVRHSRNLTFNNDILLLPFSNVHIFYYAWYGNLRYDKNYSHWNHNYIPNWKKGGNIHHQHHDAPLDIGSNFYPELGCYSSRDPKIIQIHMKQIKATGIGVVVVSWTPPNMKDSPDDILPYLFHYAYEQNLKITINVEPYHNRNPSNLRKHLMGFFEIYSKHPALYKIKLSAKANLLPVLYIYDSYLSPFAEWKELLNKKGNISIRGSQYDAVFIGLLVDLTHKFHIKKSDFDGFYTYFATNGFTYGSSWKNWITLGKFARQSNLIFVPSVGPGYIDTRIRPWNSVNSRHRRQGQYYDVAWRTALSSGAYFVSITSFNEWHEGTQIEPALPKSISGFTYLDYTPQNSSFYLNLTKWWIQQYFKKYVNLQRKF